MTEYGAKPSVAIVGFGLVGRVVALELMAQYQLTIFEKDPQDAQTGAGTLAAAMLAPLAESVICDQALAEQGLKSIAMWPNLLAKLDSQVFFQQQGSLIVAHQQDRGDLQSFQQRLKPLMQHRAESVNQIEIAKLEPELGNKFSQGLFLPCEGQLDNHAFFTSSYDTLVARGVQFHFAHEAKIEAGKVNNQAFDWIIDCRGFGAKQDKPELRGVRGEVARIYAPEVKLQRPVRLMHPRYPIYIAPKPDHQFVIGATEIESQDAADITVRSTLELLSAAYTVHSGFAEGRVMSLNAGLRPAFVDNHPHIDIQDNVISINGLYRHGYLLAPVVVQQALSKGLL
ncbi:FAD-dependent oxidoreductase [Pseudoalteromonas luteoviolacea]|uniref:FAD-dependent oxidoreductase n=1 Tax=Pseudoalteromonas luteoviolacea TaxID=43657 RepID=UPI001B382153|nr:FAD-dependent oxidoreductase [Pseudoalteromonas luteoviolacea]MBQ4839463.1 FAD-dependent oxidoreductase [Pseudoalteromonas luteoviolacea]